MARADTKFKDFLRNKKNSLSKKKQIEENLQSMDETKLMKSAKEYK